MTKFARVALYMMPPEGPLAEFGAQWLGWDIARGVLVAHGDVLRGLAGDAALAEITGTPRKYGFHGTIKPPFRLAKGRSLSELEDKIEVLCTQIPPVTLDGLAATSLGGFVALTPVGNTGALAEMAAQFVTGLDMFRAPATTGEIARRRKVGLSAAQDALLLKWGYPYVLSEFRFHLTLSGRLPAEQAETLCAAVQNHLDGVITAPQTINDICLVGEAEDGQFHLIHRYPFSG